MVTWVIKANAMINLCQHPAGVTDHIPCHHHSTRRLWTVCYWHYSELNIFKTDLPIYFLVY